MLIRIIASPEYTTTLEQVIDTQVQLITQEMMHYNDIIIDPSAYPLGQRINDELSLAGFDEDTQQLFNVFYVTVVVLCGSKVLTAKLAAKKQAFIAERDALQVADQVTQA